MSEMFRKPASGDYILPFFNRLMDLVRRHRVLAGDGILVKQTDGGTVVSALRTDPKRWPWHSYKIADGAGSITVRVSKGRWTRNPDLGNTALVLDCGTNEYLDVTVGDDQYLCAVIVRDNLDSDPMLYPTAVILKAVSTPTKTAVEAAISEQKYGGHWVIGKATSGVWAQYWEGGDITDDAHVGDADVPENGSFHAHSIERLAGGRLENQVSSDQVRNFAAGTARSSLGASDTLFVRTVDGGGAVIDTMYATPQAVVNAAAGTPGTTVPDHDHTGAPGDGPKLPHAGLSDIADNPGSDDHRGARAAATGDGDDHDRHVYLHANGDATRNAMGSGAKIGDSTGFAVLDPSNRLLYDGSGSNYTVAFGEDPRQLTGNWQVTSGNFEVPSGYAYKHDGNTGITDAGPFIMTRADGSTLNVKLAGGIIIPA